MKYSIKFVYEGKPYQAELDARNEDAAKNLLFIRASHQFSNINKLEIKSVEVVKAVEKKLF